ncbi:MAG TPA: GNAT family N-acetyltransferase [Chloroflexota bacterium]|nr:GNAT family N-acetyltransferase [Chloroflexota bacterium]
MPREARVTTWHLEMLDPAWLRPVGRPDERLSLARVAPPSAELSRFLYTAVGGDWYWTDRLPWTHAEWLAYLRRPEVETWVASLDGAPCGYVELEQQPDGNVEIAYFGLLRGFTGRRIGGHLLSVAVARAWSLGPPSTRRVWVHTCSLDGQHALANYQARGFRVFKTETQTQLLPDAPPGPWPGATPSCTVHTP